MSSLRIKCAIFSSLDLCVCVCVLACLWLGYVLHNGTYVFLASGHSGLPCSKQTLQSSANNLLYLMSFYNCIVKTIFFVRACFINFNVELWVGKNMLDLCTCVLVITILHHFSLLNLANNGAREIGRLTIKTMKKKKNSTKYYKVLTQVVIHRVHEKTVPLYTLP